MARDAYLSFHCSRRKDIMTNTDAPQSAFTPAGHLQFGVTVLGPGAEVSFEELRTLAQTAERGLFSMLTLDERYWLRGDPGALSATDPVGSNDVATLLVALAAVTTNIGLVAAAAPDYDDPAFLTRRLDSLTRISQDRAAWQVLADGAMYGEEDLTEAAEEALEDNEGALPSGGGRHALIESMRHQWQTWSRAETQGPVELLGAFERDGQKYSVGIGALRRNEPRGGPVLIHGAESAQSLATATELAEVILSEPASLEGALALRREVVARSLRAGRGANDVKIIQAATFIVAPTSEEAIEKADWIREELPESVWDERAFVGSYADVADLLLDFARSGAVDGFNVMPWLFADELADLVNHLVPALQARGIYPTEYAADTLRGNLGLPDRTVSAASNTTHALPVIEVGDLGDVRLDLDLRMELIVQKLPA